MQAAAMALSERREAEKAEKATREQQQEDERRRRGQQRHTELRSMAQHPETQDGRRNTSHDGMEPAPPGELPERPTQATSRTTST